MKKSSSLVALILVMAVGAAATFGILRQAKYGKDSVPAAVDIAKVVSQNKQVPTDASTTKDSVATIKATPAEIPIPQELNLAMTFYSQAPFGNWDEPWQNACEEASILLVANTYFDHNWTREQFRDQVLAIVDWENKNFGDYKDTNAEQMLRMLNEFVGLKGVIHKDPTFSDVQKVLAQGHLILMPFDGKLIGNPYYKNGGPEYHVMVLKGYKQGEKVITEDVGTSHGEDYVYSWSVLQMANHDWTTPVGNGAKLMIEVLPPA